MTDPYTIYFNFINFLYKLDAIPWEITEPHFALDSYTKFEHFYIRRFVK